MFPDIEALLVAWLPAHIGGARVSTDLPADLAGALPLVQVARFGGADSSIVLDRAHLAYDAFAPTRSAARALAEATRHALLFELAGTHGAIEVSRVLTIGAPVFAPYGNPALRRFGGSVQIIARLL